MKICPVCGETMEDAELLCPECGARVEPSAPAETVRPQEADAVQEDVAEAAPVKKGFSGKTVGLIAAGVGCVAVIVFAVLFLSRAFATPAQKFVAYQRQALMEGVVEPFAKELDRSNSRLFSTDMTITAATAGNEEVDALLSLKIDQRENGLLASAGLTLRGEDVLEGTLSYEDGRLGLYVPQLDDTYYTADLARMAEKWGVDELSALTELKRTTIPADQLKKLCEKYIDLVLRVANENNVAEFSRENISMEVLDGTAAGTLYVCQPSAEEWETLLLQLAYTLESDQELRDFLTACMEGQQALLDSAGAADIADAVDESLTDAAKSLRGEAKRLGRAAEEANLRWLLCLDGKKLVKWAVELGDGQEMVGLEAKDGDVAAYVISGEEKYVLSARLGKDGGARQGMISAWYDDGTDQGMMHLEYDRVEKGKSALDIPRGRYVLQITEGEPVELVLEVTESEDGGTDHLLTLPASLFGAEVRVDLHTTDKKATCQLPQKEPVDISDYSEEDLRELTRRWGEAASSLIYDLQDAFDD